VILIRFLLPALAAALVFGEFTAAPGALAQASQSSQAPSPAPAPAATEQPDQVPPPTGTVLFSRDANAVPDAQPAKETPAQNDTLAVTDAERAALTFTAYDLDVHLTPASAGISVRAGLTLRNDGAAPITRLILDITSSAHWDAFSMRNAAATALPFSTHLVDTDADHTGRMSEAAVTLPHPLAPGASIAITALYSGAIPPSAERLERIGAPADQALAADWDSIAAPTADSPNAGTALRGFGNVLWYPVSAPPVFLGDGARLFQAVGAAKLRESTASIRLRVALEYVGDPPDAAYFCGQRGQLIAISDNPNQAAAEAPGIATAVFDAQPIGFRTPSLFITANAADDIGTTANPGLIAAISGRSDVLPAYVAAATQIEPLLTDWFGARPLTPLTILDHPGQPFEDDALLVRPMAAVDPTTLIQPLAHSLTHAWIHSSRPWIDEGLAEFVSLLWTERTQGRAAVLATLQESARALAIAEPEDPDATPNPDASSLSSDSPAQSSSSSSQPDAPAPFTHTAGLSLADATGEIFYRTKAAAVWWMLRNIVGDQDLKLTLEAYRNDAKLDRDPEGFEQTLEKISHKDLHWFFNDWVYRDRGLPDLTIVNVTPSQLDSRNGQAAGWLVAVEIHNDGYAQAEVPVVVRSATSTETHMLRIPGRSSASTRIIFPGTPEQVIVNDGGVPETRTSIHTRQLVLPGR
jgi:hypothetical protein